jgi:KDO2-lipid IV(A) lauroyltransferase
MPRNCCEETREQTGAQVVNRGGSTRDILRGLHRNEIVAILPDQNDADVFVPFFGIPTGTVDGPALIHLKTSAPLPLCLVYPHTGQSLSATV